MEVLLIGGDKRQLEIINDLKKHNLTLTGFNNLDIDNVQKSNIKETNINKYDVIIFPVSGVENNYIVKSSFDDDIYLRKEFLKNSKTNVLIFTGIMTNSLKEMLSIANRDAIVLMKDKDIIKNNSVPTVEGIIGDLVCNTNITIKDANILVIGYGNIGSLLVHYLQILKAKVMVGIIDKKDYEVLKLKKIPVSYSNNKDTFPQLLSKANIIINTVPALVLNKEYLKFINDNSYVLDVASYPHGADLDTISSQNINYKILLGIPGRFASATAGKILSKKINTIINKE